MAITNIEKQTEQVNVSFDVVWQGAAGKFDARMGEISMDGCFIDSMGQETMGETINFKVHLPSGIWVTLQGEVVYQEYPIGFEVLFTNLAQENRKLLTQVVAAHGGKQAQQILREEEEKNCCLAQNSDGKRRVIIADDDPMTLEIVKAIVETQNCEVVCASDGREAFRFLQQDANFNAAIFDMTMPHFDGLDLINYMKTDERLRHIPIGMITAEQDPKIWDDFVTAGAGVFLPKPFTPPQVQMMLRMLMHKGGL